MAGNCCCRQGFPHEIFCGRRACVPHISDANLINNYLSRKILPQNLDILFIAPTWHAGQTVRTAYEFQVYVVFIISWRDKTSKYARNCRDARSVRPENQYWLSVIYRTHRPCVPTICRDFWQQIVVSPSCLFSMITLFQIFLSVPKRDVSILMSLGLNPLNLQIKVSLRLRVISRTFIR